jgi:hypothetical protein
MLGQLPTSLEVNGKSYAIRSDYRNILQIITAYDAEELKDGEKVLICLKRMYVDFDAIPTDDYEAAYKAATVFIECQMRSDNPGPKVVDWNKDSQLIFSAVNKVAGREVRAVEYMHWWTFLGYFQSVDRDDLWGFILTIRQKQAKGRKLEKYETEFYNANRSMCDIGKRVDRKKEAIDYMEALYAELYGKG